MMNKVVRLQGKQVDLCVYRTDDDAIDLYLKWVNDEDIVKWIGRNMYTYSYKEEYDWAHREHGENEIIFNIVEKSTGKLIGNCDIDVIDNTRNCVLGIMIGEKDARDRGYGTEVMQMLVKYCFEELYMHNVILGLNGDNERAHHVYKKVGFKDCIIEPNAVFYSGKKTSCIQMQILESEYPEIKKNWQ